MYISFLLVSISFALGPVFQWNMDLTPVCYSPWHQSQTWTQVCPRALRGRQSVYRWPWCGGTGGRTPAGPSQTADSAFPSGRGPPRTSPVKGLGSINQSVYRLPRSETLYHRDDALIYIAYVMLIWAAPIPADRWHCSLWPWLTPWVDWHAP